MAHVLYRRYRPQRFVDVVGQNHITTTLKEALKQARLAHAYLFSGPRGIGKTSTARILAKAANCRTRGADGEPCGTCATCKAIEKGQALDVVEIDAASNRGIDEVRALKEQVATLPSILGRKVVIVDEVHMLTREAFNALLKLLEEPPAHVMFVLATTEWQKVPKTVISRCQHFAFRRANIADLTERLAQIAAAEKFKIEPAALTLLAARAEGSFRDAIGLLDQMAALGNTLTEATIRTHLGLPPLGEAVAMLVEVVGGRAQEALGRFEALITDGVDPHAALTALTVAARTLAYASVDPKLAEIIGTRGGIGADDLTELTTIGATVEPLQARTLLGAVVEAERELKVVQDPRLAVEHLLLEWASHVSVRPEKPTKEEPVPPIITAAPSPKQNVSVDPKQWQSFIKAVREKNASVGGLLQSATLRPSPKGVKLVVPFAFHADRLKAAKVRALLQETFQAVLGAPLDIEVVVDATIQPSTPLETQPNELLSHVNEIFEGI